MSIAKEQTMDTTVTKRFCQLLVADTGQVCLRYRGWDADAGVGLLHECGEPATL